MKLWKIFTLTVLIVALAEAILERLVTWLSPAAQSALIAVALPIALALGLVAFFDWRRRLASP